MLINYKNFLHNRKIKESYVESNEKLFKKLTKLSDIKLWENKYLEYPEIFTDKEIERIKKFLITMHPNIKEHIGVTTQHSIKSHMKISFKFVTLYNIEKIKDQWYFIESTLGPECYFLCDEIEGIEQLFTENPITRLTFLLR